MRVGRVDRVKRRLLKEAVAENLDVIRGLPPQRVRPEYRRRRMWQRLASIMVIPVTVAASTYFVAPASTSNAQAPIRHVLAFGAASPASDLLAPLAAPQRVAAAAFPLAVRRITIDAGHGGQDPGTTSSLALFEKDITLDIGQRLRQLLESNGFQVVVTRSDDRTVPLRERARMANESRSDLFLSIHINSIVKHTASRGIETYYLGPTSDPGLTQLAAAENVASGYSLADLRKLLDGVYADVRSDESHRLAMAIQDRLFKRLKAADPAVEDWGVKRAPFIVLVATEMPAVLAEVGCMSSERDAVMLHRSEYRQRIAQALFEGITAYATSNEPKKGI